METPLRAASCLVALLGSALVACAPAPPPQVGSGPPIWAVRDADSQVLMVGAVHALPPDVRWRSPWLEDALARAELVVFEVMPASDVIGAGAEWDAAGAAGRLPEGRRLADVVGEALWTRVAAAAPYAGLGAVELERVEPWLASAMLDGGWARRGGYRADLGLEAWVRGRIGSRVEVVALDAVGYEALAGLSPAAQRQMLERSVRTIESRADPAALDRAWARGDVAALAAETARMRDEAPDLYEELVADRTRRWAPTVAALVERRGVSVVVVGAGHMVGPDGLPALLRARGLEVEAP